MNRQGKGMFTWKLSLCEQGDPRALASVAKSAGLSHVLVKIADGTSVYNGDMDNGHANTDYVTTTVQALKAQGIQVWGWHYIYGVNPAAEARIAAQRVHQYGLDTYVIDAEAEFEKTGMKAAATQFMGALRAALPAGTQVGLSSYRYPSYHQQFPWQEFLSKCDFIQPQVYWMQAHNPGDQLKMTIQQFKNLKPGLPVIPTGAAFQQGGWKSTAGEILEFLNAAKSLNLSAVNFWEWTDARSGAIPGAWNTIQEYPWSSPASTQQDICQLLFTAMNTRDPAQVVSLYIPTAVHITAQATIAGTDAIRQWYSNLFTKVLPNPTFTLTGFTGTGTNRHFTWSAVGQGGKIQNGQSTLNMIHDKIAYLVDTFTVIPA